MISILKRHPFILLFAVMQVFFSAPGQTFLISLFVDPIFGELGVSMTQFAGVYSAATILASFLLIPAGRLIDRFYVHQVVMVITILMAGACTLLASAQNLAMVFAGFFFLRLIGQGVYGLTASTLMIKHFHKNRGSSLGIMTLGFPLSEAVYPAVALLLLDSVGWRGSYWMFGISNLAVMLPLQLWLLSRSAVEHGTFLPGEEIVTAERMRGDPEHRKVQVVREATAGEVLRDVKFYLLLLASCVPPLVITGLLFHQNTLFESNGWPIALAASGFMVYALTKAVGSVVMGPVVDRTGPLVPFILLILLLAAGTMLAAMVPAKGIVPVYFGLIGMALGFSSPVMNVVWPHFYGTQHIGSIKGVIAMFRNGLTGLGPLPVAIALDHGITINQVLFWTAVGIFVIALIPFVVWRME